jgi:DNA-binding MarR family transcriptional regulator
VAHTRDVLELTNGELCVLRWLRISNGQATLSASIVARNSLFIVPKRLLQADYVRIRADQNSPKAVHYILTESGLKALELNESQAFFSDLGKRRRPRSGANAR